MSKSESSPPVLESEQQAKRIAFRMIVPAMATSLLLLVIGILAAVYLLRMQNQTTTLLNVEVASIRAAEEIAVMVRQAEIQIHRFIVTGDYANLDPLVDLKRQSNHRLETIKQLANTDQERVILVKLEAVLNRFWSELVAENESQVASQETLYQLADELVYAINMYVDYNNRYVQLASVRNQQISRRLAISLLILGTLGSVLGLIFGLAISRKIQRSIVELRLSIRDTTGKLNEVLEPIMISTEPDTDNLQEALATVSTKVGTVVERLAISQREHMRAEQLASLGRVSAGLAHELRNPIAAMKLLIQNALEKGTTLGDRHLTVLRDEILRLERLAKTFLDFARPPSLERHPFDLVCVYEQKLLLVSGKLKIKRLTVESEIPESPLRVEADQGQIRQLLLNLLLNAIDASPENGTIHVRIIRMDAPSENDFVDIKVGDPSEHRRWIFIEVADQGPGLPSVTMEVLFEPFFSTKHEGVGLGLPISKQIIEAHGGSIQAMNRAGGGANFRVFLPIAD